MTKLEPLTGVQTQIDLKRVVGEISVGTRIMEEMYVVVSSRSGIIEPVLDFLLERGSKQDVTAGTLQGYGYILRDWFRYLQRRGRRWHLVDDNLLDDWKRYQEGTSSRTGRQVRGKLFNCVGEPRIQTKLKLVARFYRTVSRLYEIRGLDTPLGSTVIGNINEDLGLDPEKGKGADTTMRVGYATPEQTYAGRPVPTNEEIETGLTHALAGPREYPSVCKWLWMKWMWRCGLRAGGVAALTTDQLTQALIRRKAYVGTGGEAQRATLHAISSDPDSQEAIISALAALQANGLPAITVLVREKRKKPRQVGVPIELFIETLTYVWDYRARFIEKQKDHGRDLSDSRVLWFSSKTKGPFQAKSIARAIGVVFHLAEMPGSGHRLRARYAIEQMREEIRLQLRDHGKVIDKHTILFIVAQRLGHANLQSLEYYLVDALHSLNAITDEVVHIEDTNVAARVRRLLDLIARKPGEVLDALDRLLEMQAEELPPRHPRRRGS